MNKLMITAWILLIPTAVHAQAFSSAGNTGIERKMVVRAEDIADWMISTASRTGQSISAQEAARAAEVIAQLSRTDEGRVVLTHPQLLTAQLNRNGISGQILIGISVEAARALQQPDMGGLSIREIIAMRPAVGVRQYPEVIGGEIMLRGTAVKLDEARQVVEVLRNMIQKDPDAFTRHLATVKMELINDWGVRPELADIAAQVIGANGEKMEIIVPSRTRLAGQTPGTTDGRFKEAVRYLQSRGRIDEANRLRSSMKRERADLPLSEIDDKRGEQTAADPLELGIAIYFLEAIHLDGAEFIKEMAAEDRLGSMGLQQYIALIRKDMSHEWVNVVNKNALGHIALGDINRQMKKYESDLMRYTESGGGRISLTKLAGDYVRVGDREMPYDLVALMAREPIYDGQLQMAFETRIPSLEPMQIEAIGTLSEFLPSGIRKVLEDVGDLIDMEPYEIEGMIRDLEVFRVRAASVETLEESKTLLDESQSFLVHALVNKPKIVAWLSQVSHPAYQGDTRIVINEGMQKALAEFSGIPVLRSDYSGRMEVLIPTKDGLQITEFDEQVAGLFEEEALKPIYVGGTREELAALQEKTFMLPLYAGLREKPAAKFSVTTLGAIEEALKTVAAVTESNGIRLDGIDRTVIPTRFDEIVIVSVLSDGYEAIQAQQQRTSGASADGSAAYFLKNDGNFFRFEGNKGIFGRRYKRSMDISQLQQKIYQGRAVVFAADSSFIDQATAFELFGNENYFKYHGGMVSFADPYLTKQEKGEMLAAVDALDAQMSSAFGEKRPGNGVTWTFLSGVQVTNRTDNKATVVYIPRGFMRKAQYILKISSDLARRPMLIAIRLRDMTIEQAIQEETVRDTSSITTGILDSFEPGVRETTKDKIVKWITSKLQNRIDGGPFKGMRIQRLSFREGAEFLENEFPGQIKIRLLADMTKEIVNARGADRIRTVLSDASK